MNKKGGRGRGKNASMCFTLNLFLIPSFPTPHVAVQPQPHLPISPINHRSPSGCEQQDRAASHPGVPQSPSPPPARTGGVERQHVWADKDTPRHLNCKGYIPNFLQAEIEGKPHSALQRPISLLKIKATLLFLNRSWISSAQAHPVSALRRMCRYAAHVPHIKFCLV